MKKSPAKKGIERRRKPRSSGKSNLKGTAKSTTECFSCQTQLSGDKKALFVEEEVGRVFCSEDCITTYFSPEIERLEQEYLRHRSNRDLDGDARVELAHLRWVTLEEPDEVWREKTLAGDYRYTLIAEFTPKDRAVWCICICLCLRGEPSFLYIAFPTQNETLVNHYRKGERVEIVRNKTNQAEAGQAHEPTDSLADPWTPEETLRAEANRQVSSRSKKKKDIPASEYAEYSGLLEETLENPDEVWSHSLASPSQKNKDGTKVFHFIRHYDDQEPALWYIIVAKETDDEEQIEIMDAFPTKNADLVEGFRRGNQEVGTNEKATASRMIH